MIETHAKYRAHESEEWMPVLLDCRDARVEVKTHAGRILAIWSGQHIEGLNFPVLDRRWLLRDRRIADAQLMVENDEDYGAVREVAPQLFDPRRRGLRQVWHAALASEQLAWIVVAALVPVIGLWLVLHGYP